MVVIFDIEKSINISSYLANSAAPVRLHEHNSRVLNSITSRISSLSFSSASVYSNKEFPVNKRSQWAAMLEVFSFANFWSVQLF